MDEGSLAGFASTSRSFGLSSLLKVARRSSSSTIMSGSSGTDSESESNTIIAFQSELICCPHPNLSWVLRLILQQNFSNRLYSFLRPFGFTSVGARVADGPILLLCIDGDRATRGRPVRPKVAQERKVNTFLGEAEKRVLFDTGRTRSAILLFHRLLTRVFTVTGFFIVAGLFIVTGLFTGLELDARRARERRRSRPHCLAS